MRRLDSLSGVGPLARERLCTPTPVTKTVKCDPNCTESSSLDGVQGGRRYPRSGYARRGKSPRVRTFRPQGGSSAEPYEPKSTEQLGQTLGCAILSQ
jgi:hypothetical protein